MAIEDCIITLEQDRLTAGDTLRGEFAMTSTGETKCRQATLSVGWRTTGRGDKDSADLAAHEFHRGTIPHGTISDNFEFLLPEGPISCAGHYINVKWFVQIHVNIPFGFDFTEQAEFVLLPKTESPPQLQL